MCPFVAYEQYCFYKRQCEYQKYDYKNQTIKCGKSGENDEGPDKKRSIRNK